MKINYGQLIHNKRRSLNMTEEKLAEDTDMSDRHIRNIEKGNTVPKLDTVIKIGNALQMNLGELDNLKVKEETV